jgi:hypothetical protein
VVAQFLFTLLGPIGVFYGIFEWLANPTLLAAWVFSFAGKNKIALLLGIVASALMLAFLFRHTIVASEEDWGGLALEHVQSPQRVPSIPDCFCWFDQ